MKNYELLDEDKFGNQLIRLTSSPYEGIIYHYGRVVFIEEDDPPLLRIQFEHNVTYNPYRGYGLNTDSDQDFKNYIGDILVDLIDTGLMKHEVTFTGGTDEN